MALDAASGNDRRDMTAPLLLRRNLSKPIPAAELPEGLRFSLFIAGDFQALHSVFATAYQDGFGDVGLFTAWREALLTDAEFSPALIFPVVDRHDAIIAAAQCWTSSFIKDFAVQKDWRGKGVGEALIARVLQAFAQRNARHVDLKVDPHNDHAIALYMRCGFVVAAPS
jgi:ribosomal protein S18 acetylase RimI-like enzyme